MTTGAIKLHQLGTGVEEGIDLQKFEREAFPETRSNYRVVIVGAGLSGICSAVELLDKGVVSKDRTNTDEGVLLIEQGSDVGGTWHWNRYPGCACDVASYSYLPFLHRMGFVPSKKFVTSAEIASYLESCATKLGVRDRTVFGTRVLDVTFDDAAAKWHLRTNRGDRITADFVVLALGPLSTPRLSDTKGLDKFQGALLHSSQWEPQTDLTGLRVGVVGTGATAVQLVPEVAKVASKLYVFQRTPCWCSPRDDVATTADMAASIRTDASFVAAYKENTNGEIDLFNQSLNDDGFNKRTRSILSSRIKAIVKDPATAAALTPSYPVGCKRLCVVDDYWPSFNRDNVVLVSDPRGVNQVTAKGPKLDDGTEYEVDALIMATGYEAFSGTFKKFPVHGANSVTLLDAWKDGPATLGGIHVRGFPNLFIMLGPQAPGIIANVTAAVGAQSEHIASVVQSTLARKSALTGLADTVVVQPTLKAMVEYGKICAASFPGSVWSKCDSWYNKRSQGGLADGVVDGYVGLFKDYRQLLRAARESGLEYASFARVPPASSL